MTGESDGTDSDNRSVILSYRVFTEVSIEIHSTVVRIRCHRAIVDCPHRPQHPDNRNAQELEKQFKFEFKVTFLLLLLNLQKITRLFLFKN